MTSWSPASRPVVDDRSAGGFSQVVSEAPDTAEPGAGNLRPRVAQIVTTLARGGAQATVVASCDMAEHGIDVVVLAGADDTEEGSFWNDAELANASVVEVPGLVRRLSPTNDLRALRWLVRWLRANQPDVVHTHSSKAGVLGRVAAAMVEIPCVHTVHGWGPLYSSSRVAVAATQMVERALAGLTVALVVVGEHDLRRGLANRIGKPGLYRVICSGVDVEAAASAAADRDVIRSELGLADRFVVGMVARLSYPKDHATLLRAFGRAAIVDSALVLVGDGPERQSIERLVSELGLTDRVHLLGPRADGARLVAAFDLAILSSEWEGMPRSVVEAAAASVPVVSSEVGSVEDLIVDGISGRLVPPGDVEALTEALLDAHQRPVAYRDMADIAGRRSSDFSVTSMRASLAELWSQLAATPAGTSEATGTSSGTPGTTGISRSSEKAGATSILGQESSGGPGRPRRRPILADR